MFFLLCLFSILKNPRWGKRAVLNKGTNTGTNQPTNQPNQQSSRRVNQQANPQVSSSVNVQPGQCEYIYFLELADGKYYVGKTNNTTNRFEQHVNGIGSERTKKYPPISIISQEACDGKFHEDNKVKELMSMYGIDNVRGGSHSRIYLTPEEKNYLTIPKIAEKRDII